MGKAKRKMRPQPPWWWTLDNDNCWFCKNRTNCGGCKLLKQQRSESTNFAIAIGKDLQREVNLMNNKHASIELIDEMAKVKDDFKILPKDIIESMLEDMTAEEKDMLLRLYIFGTNIDQ